MGCPTGSGGHEREEAGEESTLGVGAHAAFFSVGCPIAFQQFGEVTRSPKRGAQQGEEARKTPGPAVHPGNETQQDVKQECGPNLPFDGVFVVAEKVGQLQGLLDLLEEDLHLQRQR